MTGFVRFMSSGSGRATRVVAGAALIAVGLILGGGWIALSVVGAVPLLAGVFDLCLFAPLGHLPLSGRKARAALAPK